MYPEAEVPHAASRRWSNGYYTEMRYRFRKKKTKKKKSEVSYYLQRSLTYPPDIITKASILLLFRKYMYLTSYKHFQLCALVSY